MAPIKGSDADYSHLSDEELAQMLSNFGVTVGPINVATRRTYERRLQKLQTGVESPPSQKFESVPDYDDDDDEVQVRLPEKQRSPRQTIASHPEPVQPRLRRDFQDTSSFSYTSHIEPRANLNSARKTTSLYTDTPIPSRYASRMARDVQPASSPTPSRSSGGQGIPLWVKLVALVAVVLLVYLIYSNMEPQAVSNIPKVSQKVEV